MLTANLGYADIRYPVALPPSFSRGEVDGVIAINDPGTVHYLIIELRANRGFAQRPIICLAQSCAGCSSVLPDYARGSCLAAEHLLQLGHRHLLHFTLAQHPLVAMRVQATRQTLEMHGLDPEKFLHVLEIDPSWLDPDPAQLTAAGLRFREEFCRYLGAHPQITAILAWNDPSAVHAGTAMREHGLAIPEQYSLVGFDDTDALLHAHGQNMLTTIHLPLEEIGREAARLMIMQVTSGMVENAEIILPPELITRASTAACRSCER